MYKNGINAYKTREMLLIPCVVWLLCYNECCWTDTILQTKSDNDSDVFWGNICFAVTSDTPICQGFEGIYFS